MDAGATTRQAVGDQTAHSVTVHRGKRSLAVDLKSSYGLEIAKRLAAKVTFWFRTIGSETKKLGLDYDSVFKINPKIITLRNRVWSGGTAPRSTSN